MNGEIRGNGDRQNGEIGDIRDRQNGEIRDIGDRQNGQLSGKASLHILRATSRMVKDIDNT